MTADGDLAGAPAGRRRRFRWVKWVLGAVILALLVGEGVYLWPRLHESWRTLTEIHWGWLFLCIVLQAMSMSGFGRVQKQLLHAGGVDVSQGKSVSVVYGATAMSLTLPAGQVFFQVLGIVGGKGSDFVFRFQEAVFVPPDTPRGRAGDIGRRVRRFLEGSFEGTGREQQHA